MSSIITLFISLSIIYIPALAHTVSLGEKGIFLLDESKNEGIKLIQKDNEEVFTIVLPKESENMTYITFYDSKGNMVASAQFMEKRQHTMNLQGLSPGKYTIKIKSGTQKLTRSITVPQRGKPGTMEHYLHK